MYAGAPTVQVVTFDAPDGDFTLLPSNARLQTGTPPPGTPNYFVSTWQLPQRAHRLQVPRRLGPHLALDLHRTRHPARRHELAERRRAERPSLGGNALDVLQIRAMMQNQYTNSAGSNRCGRRTPCAGRTPGFAAPRWYQVDVTGGTVAANLPQAATWDPDGANVIHRFMPSLARRSRRQHGARLQHVEQHDEARRSSTPAGWRRDPINTFSQTEQLLIQGPARSRACGGSTCTRWGDYSAMTLDPDGCTFWYTNEYLPSSTDLDNVADAHRLVRLPACTPVGGGGTVSGTVTATVGGAPISGATVDARQPHDDHRRLRHLFASRLPAGTYPPSSPRPRLHHAPRPPTSSSTDGGTTTQNFTLDLRSDCACLTDTTQARLPARPADQRRRLTPAPATSSSSSPSLDQSEHQHRQPGTGFTTTTWAGQTFTRRGDRPADGRRAQSLLQRLHRHHAGPDAVGTRDERPACRPAPTSPRRRSPASTRRSSSYVSRDLRHAALR